jgi:hypothetical protein
MQQVKQELAAAAGAAGELPPRAAASAPASAAAAASERKATHAVDASLDSVFDNTAALSTGTVLTLGAYRVVAAAATAAFQRRVEVRPGLICRNFLFALEEIPKFENFREFSAGLGEFGYFVGS